MEKVYYINEHVQEDVKQDYLRFALQGKIMGNGSHFARLFSRLHYDIYFCVFCVCVPYVTCMTLLSTFDPHPRLQPWFMLRL